MWQYPFDSHVVCWWWRLNWAHLEKNSKKWTVRGKFYLESCIRYPKRTEVSAPKQHHTQRCEIGKCVLCKRRGKAWRFECLQSNGRKFCNNPDRNSLLHCSWNLARQKVCSKLRHMVTWMPSLWTLLFATSFHGQGFSWANEKSNIRLLRSHSFKIFKKVIDAN